MCRNNGRILKMIAAILIFAVLDLCRHNVTEQFRSLLLSKMPHVLIELFRLSILQLLLFKEYH